MGIGEDQSGFSMGYGRHLYATPCQKKIPPPRIVSRIAWPYLPPRRVEVTTYGGCMGEEGKGVVRKRKMSVRGKRVCARQQL